MTSEKYRALLHEALSFGMTDPKNALAILETGLVQLRKSGDDYWLQAFAKNAGIVCRGPLGDKSLALSYFEEARDSGGVRDMYLELCCAELYALEGRVDEAEKAYEKCLAEAIEQKEDDDIIAIVKVALVKLRLPRPA